MLQAATGKLFHNPDSPRRNDLKGAIYTNLNLGSVDRFSTKIGTLINLGTSYTPIVLGYEMTEYMEGARQPGVLASRTMDAYVHDFADVASFNLQVICTPDSHTAERLIYQRCRPGERPPGEHLARFYDASVRVTNSELQAFAEFTDKLIGLKRTTYLAAIQAIRTYVAAVHRLSDDLNLAYTLLIMCMQSLTQGFDGHESEWTDIPDPKREEIDKALSGADEELSQELRNAILKVIYPRLGHRFSQFVRSYLPADYYSSQANKQKHPVGRRDLVHTLKPLTREFLHLASHSETRMDDGKLIFTFQGLFRLMRAVIIEFVRQAEKVEHESYGYEWDNPHLLRLIPCPSTWINNPDGLNNETPRKYFQGLVELLDQSLVDYPSRKIQQPARVIEKALSIQPQMSRTQDISFLAFWYLSNSYLKQEPENSAKSDVDMTPADMRLLDEPSIDSLIVHAILNVDTAWEASDHQRQLDQYYRQRHKSTGIWVPPNVEACMALSLAERYRQTGDTTSARAALSSAVEDFPHLRQLRALEADFDFSTPISWLLIIYPKLNEQPKTPKDTDLAPADI